MVLMAGSLVEILCYFFNLLQETDRVPVKRVGYRCCCFLLFLVALPSWRLLLPPRSFL